MNDQPTDAAEDSVTPILIDLGKKSRKKTKQLKKGKGPLMDDVEDAIEQVTAKLGPDAGKIVPVVILYEKKPKKKPFGLF